MLLPAARGATAWGAWTYLVPHQVSVPSLIGQRVEDARATLVDAGFTVKMGPGEYSLRQEAGTVLHISPPPGTSLGKGATVTIIPSLGPQPVEVLKISDVTLEAARRTLTEAGFKVGGQIERYSDTVAAGRVIGTKPASAAMAPERSEIALIVSKGPPPVPVPAVVGKAIDAATAALQDLHFVVKVEGKFSATIARDEVITQDPKAGSELQPGETVTLVVSLGPKSFPMPNLVGMSVNAAKARAAELGLQVTALAIPGGTGQTVATQIPTAGSTVKYGTTITIYYA